MKKLLTASFLIVLCVGCKEKRSNEIVFIKPHFNDSSVYITHAFGMFMAGNGKYEIGYTVDRYKRTEIVNISFERWVAFEDRIGHMLNVDSSCLVQIRNEKSIFNTVDTISYKECSGGFWTGVDSTN